MDPTYPHTTYTTSTVGHVPNVQHAQEHLGNAMGERMIEQDRAINKEFDKAVAADKTLPTGTRIKGAVGTAVDWASEKTHGMKARKEENKARKHL
jgi:hypothetical protein